MDLDRPILRREKFELMMLEKCLNENGEVVKHEMGDFKMDQDKNPILNFGKNGGLKDNKGRRVNIKGYLVDKEGNLIEKKGELKIYKIQQAMHDTMSKRKNENKR